MSKKTVIGFVQALTLFAFASAAQAVIIGFEGIAPAGGQTTETNSDNVFSGFNVRVPHGHYVDSAQGNPIRPSNGTDWLLHDHATGLSPNTPVTITRSGGGAFDFLSIDVSEWENTFTLGKTLTLTGFFQGGGSIISAIATDNVFGFETINVAGFTNLSSLDIIGSSATLGSCTGFSVCGSLAYDNVVVNAAAPEPSTLALMGLVIAGLGFRSRRAA